MIPQHCTQATLYSSMLEIFGLPFSIELLLLVLAADCFYSWTKAIEEEEYLRGCRFLTNFWLCSSQKASVKNTELHQTMFNQLTLSGFRILHTLTFFSLRKVFFRSRQILPSSHDIYIYTNIFQLKEFDQYDATCPFCC